MTYGEAGTARTAVGSGLMYHGITKGSCIDLYFINRLEWLIHACSACSYISFPLYDTFGPDAIRHIVNHAAVKAIFCVPQTMSLYANLEQLCNDPRARAAVLADMGAVGRAAQLRGFEFAKAVTLMPEPFKLENGLLTPTFKIKRPQAKA